MIIRRLGQALLFVLCWMFSVSSLAVRLAEGHPDRYIVVKGDTLWDISERFLESPWLWPEVWHANPQIDNPHLIYPGDEIGLIYIDGKPRLTTLKPGENNGVVKLSPKIRSTPISTAIPTIPMDAISSFLSENRIVDESELNDAAYVLAGAENRLVLSAGDKVFARGEGQVKDAMGVYRRNQVYIDPETDELLGIEAKSIAIGEVVAVDGEVLTFEIARSNQEILQGDRLLPSEDRVVNANFTPQAPETDIRGRMIAVDSGVSQIGQYNVVVINRGAREGVKEGHVLAVYKAGGLTRDPITKEKIELPSQRAGLLMVFRVFDKLSYGLVLTANRPLAVMDEVRKP